MHQNNSNNKLRVLVPQQAILGCYAEIRDALVYALEYRAANSVNCQQSGAHPIVKERKEDRS